MDPLAAAILTVLLVPYTYLIARVASIAFFQAKLQYHLRLMTTTKEEAKW